MGTFFSDSCFEWCLININHRGELVLYTTTTDSVLRIFVPVLDSPTHLQLHATLDMDAFMPFSQRTRTQKQLGGNPPVFIFNRSLLLDIFSTLLNSDDKEKEKEKEQETQMQEGIRRMKEIREGDWDIFFRLTGEGLVVRGVGVRPSSFRLLLVI
jgi:hypothetical protein